MKRVSIQDLKAALSAVVAEASSGQTILITKHNAAVAQLGPTGAAHVHRGAGRGRLKPAVSRHTKGRYLKVLAEDRGDR